MPTYEYRCEACDKEFSAILSIDEHELEEQTCPECKSNRVVQLLSVFTAQTSRKS
jgi:putative FmdB family regulatory protein